MRGEGPGPGQFFAGERSVDGLRLEHGLFAHGTEERLQAFERGRFPASLDPADRVLARAGSQREAPLAQAITGTGSAEYLADIGWSTPHTVSTVADGGNVYECSDVGDPGRSSSYRRAANAPAG